jgi:hypothetical protein
MPLLDPASPTRLLLEWVWVLATGAVSLLFLGVPWIPGLRDIPRVSRVYRVMWADFYDMVERRRRR